MNTDQLEKAKHHFYLGLKLIGEKKWREAEVELNSSLRYLPDRVSTLNNLSAVLIALNEHGPAREAILKVLALEPDNPRALLNRGILAAKAREHEQAIADFDNAIAADPEYAEAYYSRGNALQELDRHRAAVASYDTAVAVRPAYAEAHVARGNALRALGEPAEAIASYDKAIAIDPHHAEARANRRALLEELTRPDSSVAGPASTETLPERPDFQEALALHQRGRIDEARAILEAMVLATPGQVDALHLLGVIAAQKKDFDRAVELIGEAIRIQPDDAQFHSNLGIAQAELKRFEAAVASYDRSIALAPESAETYSNRGDALVELGQFEAGLADFDKAIALWPDLAEAHYNRGNALKALWQLEAALASYDRAIALRPHFAEAHYNRGNALKELRQLDAAVASYDRAISIKPDYPEASLNKAFSLLLAGEFEKGWELYEWRWTTDVTTMRPPKTRRPVLDAPDRRKKLLIWGEQGVGDEVMFCSMLEDASRSMGSVLVQLDKRLIPLFQRSMPELTFVDKMLAVSEERYDAHIPLGSLGRFFRKSARDFARSRRAYLIASRERSRTIRGGLCRNGELLCGISWRSKNERSGPHKSMKLDQLAATLGGKNVKLVSLQYGDVASEIEAVRAGTGLEVAQVQSVDNLNDLDGLAALIDACDLVVSVNNVTVHLAGGLGKPVWALLPYSPDWRWMLESNDSYWYPSARLYRQESPGNWESALAQIKRDLAGMRRSSAP